jgi:hypothetical protein
MDNGTSISHQTSFYQDANDSQNNEFAEGNRNKCDDSLETPRATISLSNLTVPAGLVLKARPARPSRITYRLWLDTAAGDWPSLTCRMYYLFLPSTPYGKLNVSKLKLRRCNVQIIIPDNHNLFVALLIIIYISQSAVKASYADYD